MTAYLEIHEATHFEVHDDILYIDIRIIVY